VNFDVKKLEVEDKPPKGKEKELSISKEDKKKLII
jgi:hypothetical protein